MIILRQIIDEEWEQKKGTDKMRYDMVAKFYDQFESPMEFFTFANWRDHLFDKMNPKNGDLVLEIGVGTGRNIPHYRRGRYVAFDISAKMISRENEERQ